MGAQVSRYGYLGRSIYGGLVCPWRVRQAIIPWEGINGGALQYGTGYEARMDWAPHGVFQNFLLLMTRNWGANDEWKPLVVAAQSVDLVWWTHIWYCISFLTWTFLLFSVLSVSCWSRTFSCKYPTYDFVNYVAASLHSSQVSVG